ncbi:MAG: hypothetical protein PHI98_15865 [Eubacteriales bacterium]|nr:hypothetical protein [Eubacteriales bacterium]
MSLKVSGEAVAARAVTALSEGIKYSNMKCDAFVEYCVRECGGQLDSSGSNDMARNHCAWLGTLENAQAEGKLVPGAGLLIHEDTEESLPAKYVGDGLGDFSHVGIYVGENAVVDVDKKGNQRTCDVMHSSQSMGRVAGSTLGNGWTHVMLFDCIEYGVEADGLELGAEVAAEDDGAGDSGLDAGLSAGKPSSGEYYAVVYTEDGNPVKLRKTASTSEKVYWLVNCGARVRVERKKGAWVLVTAICSDGHVRRAYMMVEYLRG